MAKLLLELLHELLAHTVLFVILLKIVPLLDAGVAANGRHINHAVAELDEGAALDGDVQVGDVMQDEAHQLLVLLLADPLDEAVGGRGIRHPKSARLSCVVVFGPDGFALSRSDGGEAANVCVGGRLDP